MKCKKCNRTMETIGHESGYQGVSLVIHWCKYCKRIVKEIVKDVTVFERGR